MREDVPDGGDVGRIEPVVGEVRGGVTVGEGVFVTICVNVEIGVFVESEGWNGVDVNLEFSLSMLNGAKNNGVGVGVATGELQETKNEEINTQYIMRNE